MNINPYYRFYNRKKEPDVVCVCTLKKLAGECGLRARHPGQAGPIIPLRLKPQAATARQLRACVPFT